MFENYFLKFKGFAANGLIFAGSVHQYAQTNEELITSGIASIQELIKSDNYYLYLIPRPTYIEQNFNGDYYNTIRNNQLAAAANRQWKIINTLDIMPDGNYQNFSAKLVESLIREENE